VDDKCKNRLLLKDKELNVAKNQSPNYGIIIAALIFGLWFFGLCALLSIDIVNASLVLLIFAVITQAFLYTGLFIIAHDAMHRSLLPNNPRINDSVGTILVFCYAFFSYQKLLKNHILHHRYPASALDPDFHDGCYKNLVFWYFHFLRRYWNWRQFLIAALLFNMLKSFLQISEVNLILFWIMPSLLSSMQLFYFGTFLPHREPVNGYTHPHRAQSTSFPIVWSFLTCYHFGYHEEHHEHPQISWWQLPRIRKQSIAEALTAQP
jgi:beta-carotene/zeaxanthin 4-ketolase